MATEGQKSLREKLLQNIDDTDLSLRQLAEAVVISKESRGSDPEVGIRNLIEIVALKGRQLEETVQQVPAHVERRNLIVALEEELQKRDAYIEQLQNCLKESETVLISAVFQANQKLKSVNQASHRKVDPEELIKFAHKISKTNAVAAPLTWQQGNPERPFPTESEMQKGWLGIRSQPQSSLVPTEASSMFPPAVPSTSHSHLQSALMSGGRGGFAHPALSPRAAGVTPPFQGIQIGQRQSSPYPGTPPITAYNINSPRFPQGNVGSPVQMGQGNMIPPPPPYGRNWGPQRFPIQQAGPLPPTGYGPNSPRSARPTPYQIPQVRHSSPSMQPPASPRTIPGLGGPPAFPTSQQAAMAAQMRHRRPSTGSPRLGTPPVTGQVKQRANEVDTMSSDSSSSSSSDSPNSTAQP